MGHYINGWWYPDEQVVLGADGEPRLRRGVRPYGSAAPEPRPSETASDAVEAAEDADAEEPEAAKPTAPEARETKVIEPNRPDSSIRTKGGRG